MMLRRGSRYSRPYLLEPSLVILGRDQAQYFRRHIRRPVSTGLPLHQDELDVVLDYCIWLVWLSQKARASFHLINGIRNLVPDDWRKIVKSHDSALLLNGSMQGYNRMPSIVLAPRQAYVPNNTNQPPPGHQGLEALSPYSVEFPEKIVVVLDMPQLAARVSVFLQRPVGRRRNHQVHRFRCHDRGKLARIPEPKLMPRWDRLHRPLDSLHNPWIFREPRNIPLNVLRGQQFGRHKPCQSLGCGNVACGGSWIPSPHGP